MAVTRLKTLASGSISDPGSATEGPAVDTLWEVRSITIYGGKADVTTEEDHDDDGTFTKSALWETIDDTEGGGIAAEAETVAGGDGTTNPLERIKIESDGSDIVYVIKGVEHS